METLIGILLYIGAITTNTTYTTSDITNIESENHSIVLSIENDPEELDNAINIFLQEGDKVIVLEEIYY